MARADLEKILTDVAPRGWDDVLLRYLADELVDVWEDPAVVASDLAYLLWSRGMTAPHVHACPYADGENDADYQNRCRPCQDFLDGVAQRIVAVL